VNDSRKKDSQKKISAGSWLVLPQVLSPTVARKTDKPKVTGTKLPEVEKQTSAQHGCHLRVKCASEAWKSHYSEGWMRRRTDWLLSSIPVWIA
jgi:hypothetical protein